jgi:hypothetical protein
LFSFNCLTISSAYQSSNDCRKRFYTAFWTLDFELSDLDLQFINKIIVCVLVSINLPT